MPVTSDKPAPYAPAKTVLDIIDRFRERGLPLPIDVDTLGRAGVPTTLLPRVIQAIKTLDLITDDGKPTATFEAIRVAPEAEYKKRLEDWLKSTYADIFSFVDPAKDDEVRIRDAFRSYQPVGQQARMVTLFQGLCTAAGLMAEKPRAALSRPPSPGAAATARPRPTTKRTVSDPPRHNPGSAFTPTLPPSLAGLLASLPPEGQGWTADRRAKFLAAWEHVIDLCFPVVDEVDAQADEVDDDEAAAA
jgi:hypothetical protein